jgi:hypothetical protein
MSAKLNPLLLAALQRGGHAMASDELLNAAIELATAYGWTPEQLQHLDRRSIGKRLPMMATQGLVRLSGSKIDDGRRNATPLYEPVNGFDADAEVPTPPTAASKPMTESSYASMDRSQLMAVLEAHDDMLECMGRFFTDLTTVRDKVRRRLQGAGLVR